MPRSALQKVYADFRKGFVTVANPLAFPEGSVKDIVNFDIQDNGTVRLRPGLKQESETVIDTDFTTSQLNSFSLSVHIWNNVANVGADKIAVVQIGGFLYLFDMLDTGIDLDNQLGPRIDLEISAERVSENISIATGSGWLFVAHPDILPVVIKRTGPTSFTKEDIDIKIRDLTIWEGRSKSETGQTIGTTLYPQHEYNLRNGGWPELATVVQKEDFPNHFSEEEDPVIKTFNSIDEYPPIFWPYHAGRNGAGDHVIDQNAFNPWHFNNNYFGESSIPVGKYIVPAKNWIRGGNGETGFPEAPHNTTFVKYYKWTQNPSAIEFYAGRIWYTGAKGYEEGEVGSVGFDYEKKDNMDVTNTLYFSQQIGSDLNKVEKCYQENDPTAEDINQLLPTDGGTLSVRGIGEILDIKTFGTALVVFSSEGLWSVSGIDANSFKADAFSVNKISNIGPISKNTISATDNNIYYIASDAIYVLTTDEVTGLPKPQDITSGLIKDFYTSIPNSQKARAKAFFDTSNRNLYMFYGEFDKDFDRVADLYYNKCLVFNQDLGAFYKYEFSLVDKFVVDGIFYNKDQSILVSEPVTLDDVVVTVDSEPVTLDDSYSTGSLNNVQLLTIVDNAGAGGFTFSTITDVGTFTDFGEPYTAYVETGFDTAGDILRDSLKTPAVISHMERTEDGFMVNPDDPDGIELILTNKSGCLLSYGWDWATSYKNPQQIYRFNRHYVPADVDDTFNYGVDVITTRNRIRGKGNSLGIRLESEPGKDCRILGIGILATVAQRV